MPVRSFLLSDFDHRADRQLFEQLHDMLQEVYAHEDCILAANYCLGGVRMDALMISATTIRLFLFKEGGGQVVAQEQGAWTANGWIVEGGLGTKTPFAQMRSLMNHSAGMLKRLMQRGVADRMKGCVLFSQAVQVDNHLSPNVKRWIEVMDIDTLKSTLMLDHDRTLCLNLDLEYGIDLAQTLHLGEAYIPYRPPRIKASAEGFYQELQQQVPLLWEKTEGEAILRDVFYRMVDEAVHSCRIVFSGLFAKVDYLIKENGIDKQQAYRIHRTRKNLFSRNPEEREHTEESLRSDLRETCRFIEAVYHVPIPPALSQHFGTSDKPLSWGRFDENVLRVIVEAWDEQHIRATESESGRTLNVCYGQANRFLTREGKGDWSYLRDMLCTGAQLNLVRIRWEEDVCMPELIIFEPDYLINITAIAACFDENLKESPFVGLINKVKADEPSAAMHLGNLAGKLLDETVHQTASTYEETYKAFFHDNAMGLSCCRDMADQAKSVAMHDDGARQKQNIDRLIAEELPRVVGHYDRSGVVLEPSFFSEVLGIQGRLDFLYQNGNDTVIVEQKSGKGSFVPFNTPGYDPEEPLPVSKHIVQLLLYRALFQYEFRKYADELKHIFLLYSKYAKGLVSIANMPELLLRAIRMRNLLAWSEILYTQGGFNLLDSFTTSSLRAPGVSDRFWQTYKEPEFQRILTPLHQATPLERAYYYRFQRFLCTEQMLSKIGNKVKENSGFASVWLDTLEAKKAAGNIYDNLTIQGFADSRGTVRAITLAFAEEVQTDMSNFRKGDIVFVYPYTLGTLPNACAQMVQRGSIVDITTTTITLQLRNRQTDRKVFAMPANTRWAVEHDLMDASSSSLFRAMHSFLSTDKARRDLILLQRQPRVNDDVQLTGDYGQMNELVLHAKRAEDLFLVIGPPGTGKTSFGLLNILQEELTDPNAHVLLLSYTNRAVDEICSKLLESDIDFVRVGSDLSCDKAYRDHLADHRLRGCSTAEEVRQVLRSVRVFCGTTAALNANASLFNVKQFSLAIIDESSQILEPHIIGLLAAMSNGVPAIRKFVLIGDHKQLPAVVQQDGDESLVTEPELQEIGLKDCRLSLFERMLNHFRGEDGEYDKDFVYMLTRQGRMHHLIAEFPNQAFYEGKLDIVGSPILPHQDFVLPTTANTGSKLRDLLITQAIAFIACPLPDFSPSDKVNVAEAQRMASTILEIYEIEGAAFDEDKTVGVIVPYRNQIATLRNAIDRMAIERGLSIVAQQQLHRITIDTVERYQGSQREYILYGFTIQRDYQLNFLASNTFVENGHLIDRKLNVAMTRARRHLLLFGNPHLLSLNTVFSSLMDFLRERNCYYDTTYNL